MYESGDKLVSHPDHYQSSTGLEVIDVIEAFTENLKGIEATDTGNILKYACRWNEKGAPIRDVKKIIWYATHLLEHLEKKNNDNLKNCDAVCKALADEADCAYTYSYPGCSNDALRSGSGWVNKNTTVISAVNQQMIDYATSSHCDSEYE